MAITARQIELSCNVAEAMLTFNNNGSVTQYPLLHLVHIAGKAAEVLTSDNFDQGTIKQVVAEKLVAKYASSTLLLEVAQRRLQVETGNG